MHCKSYSHFFSKKFQYICVSFDVNFNESLTNDDVSFEQLGPGVSVLFRDSSYDSSEVCKAAYIPLALVGGARFQDTKMGSIGLVCLFVPFGVSQDSANRAVQINSICIFMVSCIIM